MRDELNRDSTTRSGRTDANAGGLARLGDLDDFKVADGDPDIRGWDVKTNDGNKIGKVEELIADTSAMKVRYIEVELDKKATGIDDDRRVLVPIGTARLNDDDDDVYVDLASADIAATPAYDGKSFSRADEIAMRDRYAAGKGAKADRTESDDFYGHPMYDDQRFFGKRRKGRESSSYLESSGDRKLRDNPTSRGEL